MWGRIQTREDVQSRLGGVGFWQTSSRNDAEVARVLHETRAVDRVHTLNGAAFFDELFCYIREIGAWPLLENLDPKMRKAQVYPFIQFVLFTIMRSCSGVQSMLGSRELLLTDEAMMGVLGFNATQVEQGCTKRGLDRQKEPVEIRGAFSFETVADNIVKIGPERLAEMFNGVIRCLAAQSMFPKQIDAVLDATDDEATPSYTCQGLGPPPSVTREKRPDVRANRRAKKIKVTVWGWKIWVVWEPTSKIPLALAIDGIHISDNMHAYAVIEQAKKNVQGYARIRSVALDRGFLDGKLLSKIASDGTLIYIPAKSNMLITKDAREIARRAADAAAQGKTVPGTTYQERHQTVSRGSGKHATTETQTTIVVGIRDLPCDWWTAEGSSSKANSKHFTPTLLNATVVLRWDGAEKDAEKEVVLLTNDPAEDPLVAFDKYDDRSLIENTCNREAKEAWFLEHHPKRSQAGVVVQAYFVFVCMALVSAFRTYKAQTDKAHALGQQTGISRYRRALSAQNRDKVIVFIGEHFGIFRNFEFALLAGVTVRDRAQMGETLHAVLQRYGAVPMPSG